MATYPRVIEGAVRKADERRRHIREAKAERRAAAAVQREEDIKRLKTLKRHELEERCSPPQPASVPLYFHFWAL